MRPFAWLSTLALTLALPAFALAAEPAPAQPADQPAAAQQPVAPAAQPAAPAAEPAAAAQPAKAKVVDVLSPVGRWKTWDDASGKAKSIVQIWEEGGKLFGKIEKLLDPPPGNPDPVCDKCSGELHNKRVIGMRILWDLKKDGDEFSGGHVLDPDNGKIYKCYIAVKDGGQKLKLRGFIGFSLLGRTQYWTREN